MYGLRAQHSTLHITSHQPHHITQEYIRGCPDHPGLTYHSTDRRLAMPGKKPAAKKGPSGAALAAMKARREKELEEERIRKEEEELEAKRLEEEERKREEEEKKKAERAKLRAEDREANKGKRLTPAEKKAQEAARKRYEKAQHWRIWDGSRVSMVGEVTSACYRCKFTFKFSFFFR